MTTTINTKYDINDMVWIPIRYDETVGHGKVMHIRYLLPERQVWYLVQVDGDQHLTLCSEGICFDTEIEAREKLQEMITEDEGESENGK